MPSAKPAARRGVTRAAVRRLAARPEPAGATTTGPQTFLRDLGIAPATQLGLVERIREGLPYDTVVRLQEAYALSAHEVGALLQIPPRTMTRRREGGRLRADESDRVLRAARLLHQAATLFNQDRAAARAWMTAPQRSLGGATPLDLAGTEVGAREVEEVLGRIQDGIFA